MLLFDHERNIRDVKGGIKHSLETTNPHDQNLNRSKQKHMPSLAYIASRIIKWGYWICTYIIPFNLD